MVLLGELYSYEGMRMRVEVPCISAWETEWAWRHVLHNGSVSAPFLSVRARWDIGPTGICRYI